MFVATLKRNGSQRNENRKYGGKSMAHGIKQRNEKWR